jgi:hypothetical protein
VLKCPENQVGVGSECNGGNIYQHSKTGKEVHLGFDKSANLTLNRRVERSLAGPACVEHSTKGPGFVGAFL